MNKHNITDFQSLLSWELWQDAFEADNVNSKFNNFLITYLRYYHSSFSKIMISKLNQSHNEWITKSIKVSRKRKKKELFILCKVYISDKFKVYYKKYCSVLSKVISNAKKLHYNKINLGARNKMKATWKIIKNKKGMAYPENSVQ